MNIFIEAPFNIDLNLKKYIDEELNNILKYDSRISEVRVFFSVQHNRVDSIKCQMNLFRPGTQISCNDMHRQAVTAFKKALSILKRQVIKESKIRKDHSAEQLHN